MDGNVSYKNRWKVKLVLTLSHGQAGVERGFSVNKDILVENMQELSLFSQRQVGALPSSCWQTDFRSSNAQ